MAYIQTLDRQTEYNIQYVIQCGFALSNRQYVYSSLLIACATYSVWYMVEHRMHWWVCLKKSYRQNLQLRLRVSDGRRRVCPVMCKCCMCLETECSAGPTFANEPIKLFRNSCRDLQISFRANENKQATDLEIHQTMNARVITIGCRIKLHQLYSAVDLFIMWKSRSM